MPRERTIGSLVVALAVAVALVAFALHRDAQRAQLRLIVQEQCLPHWRATLQPAPCSSVTLLGTGADPQGYAVLHDRKGGAHFLLIPTRTVTGIESPDARRADAPNYFDGAWRARKVLEVAAGLPLPRTAIALAVNQWRARSQDQLHIHMSCLRPGVFAALGREAGQFRSRWSPLELGGHSYYAMRVMGEDLAPANPIRLLADGLPGARDRLADYTLLVAGEGFADGPGFVLLAARDAPGSELLLDASCTVARAPSQSGTSSALSRGAHPR